MTTHDPARELEIPLQQSTPVRVVTAASLFDGHDAAINIVRRVLQAQGAEVIHLGHDRSVEEIVDAAVQEDARAVAVSSYQGGHMEFFRFLVERLRECDAGDIRVYGGGGGTITSAEARELQSNGVAQIFGVSEGRSLGLDGMIRLLLEECSDTASLNGESLLDKITPDDPRSVGRMVTWFENHSGEEDPERESLRKSLSRSASSATTRVVGVTGTGGSGKSSVVDEFVRRYRQRHPGHSVGLVLVDPTRRRSGGALLGDRIRMNAIYGPRIFTRSLATRQAHRAIAQVTRDAIAVLRAAQYDLVIVETAGIGQSDSEIVDLVDDSVYVMTPEFGAPSQLEKIDMLDMADLVVLNKFDRQGALDALRDVRKQWRRNTTRFDAADSDVPVYPTIARLWNDSHTDRFANALMNRMGPSMAEPEGLLQGADGSAGLGDVLIPPARERYLADIAETLRGWHEQTRAQAHHAGGAGALARVLEDLGEAAPAGLKSFVDGAREESSDPVIQTLRVRYDEALSQLDDSLRQQLSEWDEVRDRYASDEQIYEVRGREIRVENRSETLSGTFLPKVALPSTSDWGTLTRYLRQENLPGSFPFTAGVFPFKREEEAPTRMFAGEGGPERTNRRFHLVSRDQVAKRLSTAFDSVTLYGRNPDPRPDVYGKVGNSGVSVCTVEDAAKLYSGFDLCSPNTSVSMTINGPAPMLLAFFLNAAIDQGVEKDLRATGEIETVRQRLAGLDLPRYEGELPEGHDGLGLALLGTSGADVVEPERYERIRQDVLRKVRGTVQADILKEDQAQNTCIFSTEFALRMMGDIQEYFVDNQIRNFYSVSISGYHMAEAGANPITQLAFTLANGFTFCEYYAARGLDVDAYAPNFSFFFSNGLDAEYNVIGRVARRIWAIAMKERYGASERSQKLKYHTQTSGRSLHAQEMSFNDIRTTLQALMALQDQCNSLHTNAYDEALTTPTEASVRQALAIQLIIQREHGIAKNENPLQGSYVVEELTDLVEEAVLQEFERLSARGGVLGAMETRYQRGRIQDESMHYESLKQSGELPIVGVNTFEHPDARQAIPPAELIRSSNDEKDRQLANLRDFEARNAERTPEALRRLQEVARSGGNVFGELMRCVRVASLGQISDALFEVGGRYRRSM
ncbi:methylmalonyl-CoA mutase family protein [Myxococcota bacterium]|nr:methylmalonyl-CoA mutase family protein [Myxococcota bacterium]